MGQVPALVSFGFSVQLLQFRAASKKLLKLWILAFTPNDLMATNTTGEEGRFYIAGFTKEFTRILPLINIYHGCNDREVRR